MVDISRYIKIYHIVFTVYYYTIRTIPLHRIWNIGETPYLEKSWDTRRSKNQVLATQIPVQKPEIFRKKVSKVPLTKKNQKKLFVKPDQNPVRCSKAICFCTPTFLQDVVVKDVEYLHIRIAGPHVVVPSALHPVHQRRPAEAMKMDTLW